MKESTMIFLAIVILILFGIAYALICIPVGLYNHFKAKDMTLKERINHFINEEIESEKYSRFFINR
jgi:hypothetical protein